jgi:hypothetical protein
VFTPRPTEGVKMIQAFYKGAGPSPEKLRRPDRDAGPTMLRS